ncbi:unnamed protein product, partial [Ectocarpus fasciculatus]
AAGKRPVLCLAHARVWPSATRQQQQQQLEVVDLIATGDTGGTVTVWQFYSGGGGSGGGSTLPSDHGEFVYRGPAGRRRGGAAGTGLEGAAAPPCHALVPVLEYRAHQMGVLCMAVHVPAGGGGRAVIVTGGDDQAICVAELEVVAVLDGGRCSPTTIASDLGRSSSQGPGGQGGDEAPARKRRSAVRLVVGSPQVIKGAAGSAIKGMKLLPVEPPPSPNPPAKAPGPSTESPITMQSPTAPSAGVYDDDTAVEPPSSSSSSSSSTTPTVEPGVRAGAGPPCSLSLFTVARDQRLSLWDLVTDGSSSSSDSSFGSGGNPSSSSEQQQQQQQPTTTPAAGTNDRREASELTTPRRRDNDDDNHGGAVGGSSCCPSGSRDDDRDPLRARRRPMLSSLPQKGGGRDDDDGGSGE